MAGKLLFGTPPIQSYYGPLAAATGSNFLLANGLILNNSLTVIGGAEKPGVTQFTFPPSPANRPTRPSSARASGTWLRSWLSTAGSSCASRRLCGRTSIPPRATILALRSNWSISRPAAKRWWARWRRTRCHRVRDPALECPGAPPGRRFVGNPLCHHLSGLRSYRPRRRATLRSRPSPPRARLVNSSDGSANIRPGSFITVTGRNLAETAAADSVPAPTVLGGSCVTFNDFALPLLQTSSGQILAQVPENVSTGDECSAGAVARHGAGERSGDGDGAASPRRGRLRRSVGPASSRQARFEAGLAWFKNRAKSSPLEAGSPAGSLGPHGLTPGRTSPGAAADRSSRSPAGPGSLPAPAGNVF